MVAAGALVTPDTRIPSGEVWGGNPARFLRKLTDEEIAFFAQSASNYANLAQTHFTENTKGLDESEAEKLFRKKFSGQSNGYNGHVGVSEILPEQVVPEAATRGPQ